MPTPGRIIRVPMAGRTIRVPVAGRTIKVPVAGRTIKVTMVGRTTDKGAYPTKRIITATRATATLTVTATKATATLTIPATNITDSPARGIRGAAMKAGLDCRFPLTPTIGARTGSRQAMPEPPTRSTHRQPHQQRRR
jgi:hypothetical protein